jgi:peptidoglycan/LPS O-acetylase OafA/YrhL
MFGKSKSFKDILDAHRGIGPGFDVLRILLATTIFYGHAKWISGHPTVGGGIAHLTGAGQLVEGGWVGLKRPIMVSLVPAFFAVSGFLVTGSAVRTRVTSTFLAFRALRIFPALVVEVTLSALLLGFFLTKLTPAAYFTDPAFFRYLGNMVGWITFDLPGVFLDNPVRGVVNANLWTLPSEFDCYLITALLMATGLLYRRNAMTIIFVAATVVLAALNLFSDFSVTQATMAPTAVTYYFFMGVIFYHWREKIPFSWPLFVAAGAMGYFLQTFHHAVYLAPVFVTYCALFFGMVSIPKNKLISSGDYSYGIYLYGFPITQAVVTISPGLQGHGWTTLVVSGLLTVTFAVASWHLIEKPALALKKRLPAKYFPSSRPVAPVTPKERAEVAA